MTREHQMALDVVNEYGAGHLHLWTVRNPRGESLMYLTGRDGDRWYAELSDEDEGTPGALPGLRARSLPDLARRVARHYGVTGTVRIENEVTGRITIVDLPEAPASGSGR